MGVAQSLAGGDRPCGFVRRDSSAFQSPLWSEGARSADFDAVSFFLIGITMLANYIPAFRATKVDPMVTLRHE